MFSWLNLKIRNLYHLLPSAQLCSLFHNQPLSVQWISVSSLQLLDLFSNVRKHMGGIRLNVKQYLGDWKAAWTTTAKPSNSSIKGKETEAHTAPSSPWSRKEGREGTLCFCTSNTDGNLISQGMGGQLTVLTWSAPPPPSILSWPELAKEEGKEASSSFSDRK